MAAGQKLDVVVKLDSEPREVSVPADFAAAMRDDVDRNAEANKEDSDAPGAGGTFGWPHGDG